MSDARDSASVLPPLCHIRHPETDETVIIIRGEPGWRPAHTNCSPECLNAKLAHPPTPEQILAMKHCGRTPFARRATALRARMKDGRIARNASGVVPVSRIRAV